MNREYKARHEVYLYRTPQTQRLFSLCVLYRGRNQSLNAFQRQLKDQLKERLKEKAEIINNKVTKSRFFPLDVLIHPDPFNQS